MASIRPRLLAPDDSTPQNPWPAASVLRAVVLTGAIHPAPPFEYVKAWTDLERGIVYDWAMRHLGAGDGRVSRPMPELIKRGALLSAIADASGAEITIRQAPPLIGGDAPYMSAGYVRADGPGDPGASK